MNSIKQIVGIAIALIVAFLVLSTTTLRYLEGSYTTVGYCQAQGSIQACTDCNNTDTESTGYKTLKNECSGVIGSQNNTHCYGCADWGYRDVSRGLQLLVFMMAMVGTGLWFLKYRKII